MSDIDQRIYKALKEIHYDTEGKVTWGDLHRVLMAMLSHAEPAKELSGYLKEDSSLEWAQDDTGHLCKVSPTLVPLSEEEVYEIMRDTCYEMIGPLGEEITRDQAKAVCNKFGVPAPRDLESEVCNALKDAAEEIMTNSYGIRVPLDQWPAEIRGFYIDLYDSVRAKFEVRK